MKWNFPQGKSDRTEEHGELAVEMNPSVGEQPVRTQEHGELAEEMSISVRELPVRTEQWKVRV
jgi:hypothetical protein